MNNSMLPIIPTININNITKPSNIYNGTSYNIQV